MFRSLHWVKGRGSHTYQSGFSHPNQKEKIDNIHNKNVNDGI